MGARTRSESKEVLVTEGNVAEVKTLDVREITPRERHPLIFQTIHDLKPGTALRLVNDHDPKPLYYQEPFLDAKLGEYLAAKKLKSADEIVPDEFVRWVFPSLVEHRRPRYEALAAAHGYTIDAVAANRVRTEDEFLALIAAALG